MSGTSKHLDVYDLTAVVVDIQLENAGSVNMPIARLLGIRRRRILQCNLLWMRENRWKTSLWRALP